MQRLFIGCIFLFAFLSAFGQNPEIDSMRVVLKTAPQDTGRVRTLCDLSESLRFYDKGEALAHAEAAYQLAGELEDILGRGVAAHRQSTILHDISDDEKAMHFGLEAIELLNQVGARLHLARAQMSVGILHADMQNQSAALEHYDLAENTYQSINRPRGARIARHNRAIIYSDQGKLDTALALYRDNLSSVGFAKQPVFLAATINNIGNVYNKKENWDSAAFYFNLAIQLKRKHPDKSSRANSHNNFAEILVKTGNRALARRHLDTAFAFSREGGSKEREMEAYQTSAMLNELEGNFQAAIADLHNMLDLRDSLYQSGRAAQLTQLSAFYASGQQRHEIDMLSKQNEIDAADKSMFRWLTLGLVLVLALVGGLLASASMRSRERTLSNNELLRKNQEIERQKQEIVAQNEVLLQQNQSLADLNQEKDGLIGIVAHDIRAPLNRSAALAELIASVGPLNEDQTKFLDMIRKVSDDGARLIQDLLELNAYERKDARVDFQEVAIHDLVQASVHGFQAAAECKNIGIEVKLMPDPLRVQTDGKLLTRILDNLLSNAIKFTHRDKHIYVSVQSQNGQMYLTVRDEGQGMSEEDQAKMFRKFQRLSARPTGGETSTGLGLSIIKTLVERLDGRIRVKSELGVGTEFRLSFPLAHKRAGKTAEQDRIGAIDS